MSQGQEEISFFETDSTFITATVSVCISDKSVLVQNQKKLTANI